MSGPTPAVAANAIYSQWITEWGVTTPYAFDNEAFDPDESEPWARVSVRHEEDSEFVTLGATGNRKVRRGGKILVQVFAPSDSGTTTIRTLAKQAGDVFEGKTFSSVCCYAATPTELGPVGAMYQVLVQVPFDYEERK